MPTASDLVLLTQNRYLRAGGQPARNRLASAYTAGSRALAFTYDLRGIQAGATVSVGLNVFYVWSVDTTAKTAVVDGGQNGSVDVNAATGANVTVGGQFTDFDVFTALNEELAALSSPGIGLFKIVALQFPYVSSRVGFDLTGVTDIQQIIEVRYVDTGSELRTPVIGRNSWRLERNNPVGEFASTYSLKILEGGSPGRNITVLYRSGFTAFAALTDNATVTGLPTTAYDIPPIGAAMRLLVGREVRRNDTFSQGDTRRAEEVGPGAQAASYRNLAGMYQRRVNEEVSRLTSLYPARTG